MGLWLWVQCYHWRTICFTAWRQCFGRNLLSQLIVLYIFFSDTIFEVRETNASFASLIFTLALEIGDNEDDGDNAT